MLTVVTPGLDTVMVLRTALLSGRRAATGVVLGITLGCLGWAVASLAGLFWFALQTGATTQFVAEWLPAHADVWDRIVAREGLRPIPLLKFLGESHHYIDALTRPGVIPRHDVRAARVANTRRSPCWRTQPLSP